MQRHAGRDDVEQAGVDAVRTRGEDGKLAAFFATVEQERAGVLEVVAVHRAAEDPFRGDGLAGVGEHEPDLAGRNANHRRFQHPVLDEPVAEMEAGREGVRLVARLPVQCDDLPGRQLGTPELLDHDADFALIDEHGASQPREQHDQGN
jgi:hypothetical protein